MRAIWAFNFLQPLTSNLSYYIHFVGVLKSLKQRPLTTASQIRPPKIDFLLRANVRMLTRLLHEAILLMFFRMKPVYFAFMKLRSQLLQISKGSDWELSEKIVDCF